MSTLFRHAILLTVATVVSWWFFLRTTDPVNTPTLPPDQAWPLALTPIIDPSPAKEIETLAMAEPDTPAEEADEPELEQAPPVEEEEDLDIPEPTPPAPELGAPDAAGTERVPDPDPPTEPEVAEPEEAIAEPDEAKVTETADPDAPPRSEELMADADLVASARAEFAGETAKGFETVLLASPEEQLDIARFFGEELVLVPRRVLDPDARNPGYFHVRPGRAPKVEAVDGRPPLERYRQYRDLFDYEYARLPKPLRELRRSVLARNEVYLFAALIPAHEWAVVIGRRTVALAQSERDLSDVRRFVIRYVRRSEGGFDMNVEEIVFSDGHRFRPAPAANRSPQEGV